MNIGRANPPWTHPNVYDSLLVPRQAQRTTMAHREGLWTLLHFRKGSQAWSGGWRQNCRRKVKSLTNRITLLVGGWANHLNNVSQWRDYSKYVYIYIYIYIYKQSSKAPISVTSQTWNVSWCMAVGSVQLDFFIMETLATRRPVCKLGQSRLLEVTSRNVVNLIH